MLLDDNVQSKCIFVAIQNRSLGLGLVKMG